MDERSDLKKSLPEKYTTVKKLLNEAVERSDFKSFGVEMKLHAANHLIATSDAARVLRSICKCQRHLVPNRYVHFSVPGALLLFLY